MIVLSVAFRVPPDEIAAIRAPMATFLEAMKSEPGCLVFTFAEDVSEPGLFRAFEIYKDKAALDAHKDYQHFKDWRAATGQYERIQRRVFEASEIQ